MKRITTFILLLILMSLLVGCGLFGGDPDPTATPAPTSAPVEAEPTEAPAEAPVDEPEVSEEPAEAEAMMISEVALESSPYTALAVEGLTMLGQEMAACPVREFPIPDPVTNTKRPLDFTPFAEAMAGFTPEMAAGLDASLINATLPEIQALLADGTITSEQLVLYYLDRIQRYDVNKLNSIMELNPAALTDAQTLDSARPADAGGLYGVPIVVKDNIAVAAPLHTTAGNYALKDWQASRDAFLVQKLRDAGAIILGKANLSEWANYTDPCMPNGFSALGGQVRHAWGPFDPFGSSTGSAVSVSANLVPVSIGSETSGSLTAPARSSGVVGLRPSQGLISGDNIVPLESNLDTAGPMGHSVTDIAILLNALTGVDANDPNTERAAALAGTDFTQFLSAEAAQPLKVGVVLFDNTAVQTLLQAGAEVTQEELDALSPAEWQQMSDQYAAPFNGAATQPIIDMLQSQGIEVVTILESELPTIISTGEVGILNYGFQNSVNTFLDGLGDEAPVASLAEAVSIVNEDAANRAPYGQRFVEWSAATETTADVYDQAVADGHQYYTDWFQWFKDAHDVDVILMGALYQSAGLANIPALTIPTGLAPNSQPAGVIISGPYLSDGEVLAVGYALEQALGVEQQPDLEATMGLIAPVTGQTEMESTTESDTTEPKAEESAATGEVYSHEVVACPDHVLQGQGFLPTEGQMSLFPGIQYDVEMEGETFSCGVVVVPENYAEPDGRTIELFYLKLHSSSNSPAADPVVYLAGGPGTSGSHELSGIPANLNNVNLVREQRDVYAYDQRGTGFSSYLACSTFPSAIPVFFSESEDAEALQIFAEIQQQNPNEFAFLQAYGICPLIYQGVGDAEGLSDVDLSQYHSVASAHDIATMMEVLGHDDYNLIGTSYGTRLAQIAMRETPDHIRSVILDGPLVPSISNTQTTFASRVEQYVQIFKQCAADAACNEAYPNLAERFGVLLAELEANPIVLDPQMLVNPQLAQAATGIAGALPSTMDLITPDFFTQLAPVNNYYPNGGIAHKVPRLILALEEGDLDTFRATIGYEPEPAQEQEQELSGSGDQGGPPPVGFQANNPLYQAEVDQLIALAQNFAGQADHPDEAGLKTAWISTVFDDLAAQLFDGANESELMVSLIAFSILPTYGPDVQALLNFADNALTEPAAEQANLIANNMSRTELRETMWFIHDLSYFLAPGENRDNSVVYQWTNNCAEDTGFRTTEDAEDYLAASPYPQINVGIEIAQVNLFVCEFYPQTLDESVIAPVTSDIPTLIFGGELDTQTPFSWSEQTDESLANSYLVNWPNMGHIAIGHDQHQCSGAIGATFLDNPDTQPDINCAQSDVYKLNFLLP